ncbi:MAG: bifunctional phosphoserine phosphatase/homoserine phosphotransferase ThrH [Minisyncoccia bacterium]
MKIICMDLEGVLIPEFWEEFAIVTGIKEFALTTRDISDYKTLMEMRIDLLEKNKYNIQKIKEVVSKMKPFPGAPEFIKWIRETGEAQPIILTGSFYDYIMPLIGKLGFPLTFANKLEINKKGEVVGYKLREKDGKIEMVQRLQQAGYFVIAIGDSFNDLKMLKGADKGILFRASPKLLEQEKDIEVTNSYEELMKIITKIL